MLPRRLEDALKKDVPVLFVNIGWAEKYDGTEQIEGKHGWLKADPENKRKNWERRAFVTSRGSYRCGIGRGRIKTVETTHVVFASLDPGTKQTKIVGVYASAKSTGNHDWARVSTKLAYLIPLAKRPPIEWPNGQGVRRWAKRSAAKTKRTHPGLYDAFRTLLLRGQQQIPTNKNSSDPEVAAFEGKERKRFIVHRTREWRKRQEKIADVLRRKGKLICEVRRCGFDFEKTYGALGRTYAHVHHKKMLSKAGKRGQKTLLKDLAIVCANCHAMIHLGGQCRPLRSIIPPR